MGSQASAYASFKTLEDLAKALDGLSGTAEIAGYVIQVDQPENDHLQVVLHGDKDNVYFLFEAAGQARRYLVKGQCVSGPVKVLTSWDEAAMDIVDRLSKGLRGQNDATQLALDRLAMLRRRLESGDFSIMDMCELA